jgi:ubiquinone/menaquinone biosynthesis C-methylase UbiE
MALFQDNELNVVRQINRLWTPVYPGIAKQVAEYCSTSPKHILEVGCFSGGAGLCLLEQFPSGKLTVVLEYGELERTFYSDWREMLKDVHAGRVSLQYSELNALNLSDQSFDLVFCRGAFFFFDPEHLFLREIDRVVRPGGFAFIGGGFGSYTPSNVIDTIAKESRRLNYELRKRIMSNESLVSALAGAGLEKRAEIVDKGGLWVVIRK